MRIFESSVTRKDKSAKPYVCFLPDFRIMLNAESPLLSRPRLAAPIAEPMPVVCKYFLKHARACESPGMLVFRSGMDLRLGYLRPVLVFLG